MGFVVNGLKSGKKTSAADTSFFPFTKWADPRLSASPQALMDFNENIENR
jgi:hypothetical protein